MRRVQEYAGMEHTSQTYEVNLQIQFIILLINLSTFVYLQHSECDARLQHGPPQADHVRGHEECETHTKWLQNKFRVDFVCIVLRTCSRRSRSLSMDLTEVRRERGDWQMYWISVSGCEGWHWRTVCASAGEVWRSTPAAARQSGEVWQSRLCPGEGDDLLWETLLGGEMLWLICCSCVKIAWCDWNKKQSKLTEIKGSYKFVPLSVDRSRWVGRRIGTWVWPGNQSTGRERLK